MRARSFGGVRFATVGALKLGGGVHTSMPPPGRLGGAENPAAPAPTAAQLAAAESAFNALPNTVKYPKPPAIANPKSGIQPIQMFSAPTFKRTGLVVTLDSGQAGQMGAQAANDLTALIATGNLNDYTVTHLLGNQAASLLATSTNLYSDVESVWKAAEAGAAAGLAIGVTTAILASVLSAAGFGALISIINTLVAEIVHLIVIALAEVGITAISTGAAAGGSFGAIGAIVGAIIGAIVALGNILYGGPHLQITDGRTFSSSDYAGTNLKQASDWLTNNPDKLIGLTALRFSKQAALFLVNPHWLYLNQDQLGISQPTPPDWGTGAPLDVIYTLCPGALELLNRAQFAHAVTLVNTTPQHLDFYQSIPRPGTTHPSQDPNDYTWLPCTQKVLWGLGYQSDASDWGALPPQGVTGRDYPPIPNDPGIEESWLYTAPPNLLTNDNTYSGTWPDGQGKISGQTDPPVGTYALQDLFPSLTKQQCDLIFSMCTKAYGPVADLLPPPTESLSDIIASIQAGKDPLLGIAPGGGAYGLPTFHFKPAPAPAPAPILSGPIMLGPIITPHFGPKPTPAPKPAPLPATPAQKKDTRAKYVRRFVGAAAALAIVRAT